MNNLKINYYLDEAIKEAQVAFNENEVPVGAVIVKNGKILAKAHNFCVHSQSNTEHAEMIAMREAQKIIGSGRLDDCSLYITLEPCVMCYFAASLNKIKEIIYIVKDEKFGFSNYIENSKTLQNLNILSVEYRKNEILSLMNEFFKKLR